MESKAESKYERLRKIGIGSYGVVFKCVNRQTGQIVAIKRYSENDTDPIIRKIAMREVRMLCQLKHPNLIQLIEVFRRKRRLHLVFDYCELTVLDVIEKYANNCPLNLIRKIIWQLVNGVGYCHSHNCIHRDIKPENILINQSGVVKLCDFGFARSLTGQQQAASKLQSKANSSQQSNASIQLGRDSRLMGEPTYYAVGSLTAAGASGSAPADDEHNLANYGENFATISSENKENYASLVTSKHQAALAAQQAPQQATMDPGPRLALTEYVATRWYRAPELLVGETYYDTKIDIWAIGCVTAELMRGEPIWPGKTDLDQLFMIKSSLGQLTASQRHTLLLQSLYDQASTERLLSEPTSLVEPLERKLPARVGQLGAEFVLVCLQMDPTRRPSSEKLLQHAYIHSARMAQFVKGAGLPALAQQAPISADRPTDEGRKLAQISEPMHHRRAPQGGPSGAISPDCRHKSSASSPTTLGAVVGADSNELKWIQVQQPSRTNSRALVLAASGGGGGTKAPPTANRPANKRLAMAQSGRLGNQQQQQHRQQAALLNWDLPADQLRDSAAIKSPSQHRKPPPADQRTVAELAAADSPGPRPALANKNVASRAGSPRSTGLAGKLGGAPRRRLVAGRPPVRELSASLNPRQAGAQVRQDRRQPSRASPALESSSIGPGRFGYASQSTATPARLPSQSNGNLLRISTTGQINHRHPRRNVTGEEASSSKLQHELRTPTGSSQIKPIHLDKTLTTATNCDSSANSSSSHGTTTKSSSTTMSQSFLPTLSQQQSGINFRKRKPDTHQDY